MSGSHLSSNTGALGSLQHKRPGSLALARSAKRQRTRSVPHAGSEANDETTRASSPLVGDSENFSIPSTISPSASSSASLPAPLPDDSITYGPHPWDNLHRGADVVIRTSASNTHYIVVSLQSILNPPYLFQVADFEHLPHTAEGLPIVTVDYPDQYLVPALHILYLTEIPSDCDLMNRHTLQGVLSCAIALGIKNPAALLPALGDFLSTEKNIGHGVLLVQRAGWGSGCKEAYAAALRLSQAKVDKLASVHEFATFRDDGAVGQYRRAAVDAATELIDISGDSLHINFDHDTDLCFYDTVGYTGHRATILMGDAQTRVPCAAYLPKMLRLLVKALEDRPAPETALELTRTKIMEQAIKCCEGCEEAIDGDLDGCTEDLERFAREFISAYKERLAMIPVRY
ncbi:hypothetical protein PsYK624_150250 [Phanerochaete sordida]|uniref:Uncharacterized protein n=1 Tax=Phanerochaete sordida TaxID=48140 RepID=A0A9P3GR25_9APHY|nr:hypothetical protein PsYK624_150250 [Phanerochaete sordida]